MMRARGCTPFVVASLLLLARPAPAFDEMVGTRATGMGGALRAAAATTAGVYVNPSGLPLTRSYVAEAVYDFRPTDNLSLVGVALTDSVTNSAGIAAGLYYNFLTARPSFGGLTYTRRGHEAGLAIAYPILPQLILGVTNKYQYLDTTDESNAFPGARAQGYTIDVGATVRLADAISIAAVGQNLVDQGSWEAPPTLGVGIAASMGQVLVVDFDAVIRWLTYPGAETEAVGAYHVGGEYFFGGRIPLRLGYSFDYPYQSLAAGLTDGDSFFHAGIGYIGPQFGLEFGMRQQLSQAAGEGSDRETLLAFSLKLFVQ